MVLGPLSCQVQSLVEGLSGRPVTGPAEEMIIHRRQLRNTK